MHYGVFMNFYRTKLTVFLLCFGISSSLVYAREPEQRSEQQWSFSSGPEQTQLIELYTSEGCSSCPPAERWLSQYRHHAELWQRYVPVAFHVDYWDYLGWKDPFASSRHSQRQRNYRHSGNSSSVYTPQFMVNGNEWRGFFSRPKHKLPSATAVHPGRLLLNTQRRGDVFSVETQFESQAQYNSPLNSPLRLHLALLGADINNPVKRGENAGRTLQHHFVVLQHQQYPLTHDLQSLKDPQTLKANADLQLLKALPANSHLGLAAWISNQQGHIIQATGGWLNASDSQ